MGLNADHYYGATAANYDRKRFGKAGWDREQEAVEDLVRVGPVLDVPLGTGRYLEIYRHKGLDVVGVDISDDMLAEARRKCPDVTAFRGSIFDLPFDDGHFETVVCSRMLNWFRPEGMAKAVRELRRVGVNLVVSIMTGKKGLRPRGNYTHSLYDFYRAIDGLHIAARIEINRYDDRVFEFFRLRKPAWGDVVSQFDWHQDGHDAIERLSRIMCERFGVKYADLSNGKVGAEYWPHKRVKALLHEMHIITEDPPRFDDGPITIFRTQGHEAIIDGRRRANHRVKVPGVCPVLLVDV